VDASVVVAALLGLGREGAWAEGIVSGSLVAPEHLHVEAVSVLRREVHRGRLDLTAAAIAL
jgi:predicted nucleic acid-binding protein